MSWPHTKSPGPGITFFEPQRKPFPWPGVLIVFAVVLGWLVVLALGLVVPVLSSKGMP